MANRWLSRFLCAVCACALSHTARAEDMDLALSRLSTGACERTLGDADDFALEAAGRALLAPDNDQFRQLVSQLSSAAAPPLLAPVTTRGPGGFDIAIETTVTGIDHRSEAWRRGSNGRGAATCNGRNEDVARALTTNRLRFTKGLPLGLSVSASVGKLHRTQLWTLGGELKLAIVEGALDPFTPSVALRAASSSLVGDPALSLTTLALDVIVSKEYVVAETLKVSPYLSAGGLFTRASTGTVDLTPNIDATACALGTDAVCSGQGIVSTADFAHERRFRDASLMRSRAMVGVWLRYALFALAAEAAFDLLTPRVAGGPADRQWSVNVAPSLSF